LDYFLYAAKRQTFFNLVEHYIPYFSRLQNNAKVEILLYGIGTDYNHLNTI
jgi:hypothetical protein